MTNTKRTPEEIAAFKAANLANAQGRPHIIKERTAKPKFTITWTTASGKFGWTTVRCSDAGEAVEAFRTAQNRGACPADAQVELIKAGGQEL